MISHIYESSFLRNWSFKMQLRNTMMPFSLQKLDGITDLEEEKKAMLRREIDQFRNTYKVRGLSGNVRMNLCNH